LNERLGSFVVDPGSTSNLTYEISGISNEIGLNSFRIAPMSESIAALEDCKYVSGQFYHVSFTSSFNQFATFINALERYRPFIFVDTFSISQSRQGNQEHDVQMQLAILVAKSDKAKEGKG
jgi:Tfp pilus assembly protein PilN